MEHFPGNADFAQCAECGERVCELCASSLKDCPWCRTSLTHNRKYMERFLSLARRHPDKCTINDIQFVVALTDIADITENDKDSGNVGISMLSLLAADGHVRSLGWLGMIEYSGLSKGTPAADAAFARIRTAADSGHVASMQIVGERFIASSIKSNIDTGIEYLKLAILYGCGLSGHILGKYYTSEPGISDLEQMFSQGMRLLETSSEMGILSSIKLLAEYHRSGVAPHLDKNMDVALQYFETGANKHGDTECSIAGCEIYTEMAESGSNDNVETSRLLKSAFNCALPAAESGSEKAASYLEYIHYLQTGTVYSLIVMKRVANSGCRTNQRRVARILMRPGAEQDCAAAIQFYKLAAAQECRESHFSLWVIYSHSSYRDAAEAEKHLHSSFRLGYLPAQKVLSAQKKVSTKSYP